MSDESDSQTRKSASTQHESSWVQFGHDMVDTLQNSLDELWKKQEKTDKLITDMIEFEDELNDAINDAKEWIRNVDERFTAYQRETYVERKNMEELVTKNMTDFLQFKETTRRSIALATGRLKKLEEETNSDSDEEHEENTERFEEMTKRLNALEERMNSERKPDEITEGFKDMTQNKMILIMKWVQETLQGSRKNNEHINRLEKKLAEVSSKLASLEHNKTQPQHSYQHPNPPAAYQTPGSTRIRYPPDPAHYHSQHERELNLRHHAFASLPTARPAQP